MADTWQLWLAQPEAASRFDPQAQSFEDRRRWSRAARSQRSSDWAASRALLAHAAPGDRARSLAHSGGFAALAVAPPGARVGVDLERVDRKRDCLRLARFAFDSREAAQIEALAGEAREERFYVLWTLKEAAIKALGLTLLQGLRRCIFADEGGHWSARLPVAAALFARVYRPRPDLYLAALALDERVIHWLELEWPRPAPAAWPQVTQIRWPA